MARPRRTKSCTFPGCDGRMVLSTDDVALEHSLINAGAAQHRQAAWFWECDTDPSHIERASPDDIPA